MDICSLLPRLLWHCKRRKDHLYQHAWSEAMSFIYILYTVDELNKKIGVQTNGQLFSTGYSQGGPHPLPHKILRTIKRSTFPSYRHISMSGAYDMTERTREIYVPRVSPSILFTLFIGILPRSIPCIGYRQYL